MSVCKEANYNKGTSVGRSVSVDRIAATLRFDMAAWWRPTKETFFERLTKAQICEVIADAHSTDAVRSLDGLKKSEMAAKAAELISGRKCLPPMLREVSNETVVIRE